MFKCPYAPSLIDWVVFVIDVTFLWKVDINNKQLSLLTSSVFQTSYVNIWTKFIHYFTSYSVWKQPTSEFFTKMEKSEFRVLIKHGFFTWKNFIRNYYKAKLDKYFSDSTSPYETRNDQWNLWYCFESPQSESAWDSWYRIHLNWACDQYFVHTFVNEKALCKIGAAIGHNRPKITRRVKTVG